jgi:hypothetical protein
VPGTATCCQLSELHQTIFLDVFAVSTQFSDNVIVQCDYIKSWSDFKRCSGPQVFLWNMQNCVLFLKTSRDRLSNFFHVIISVAKDIWCSFWYYISWNIPYYKTFPYNLQTGNKTKLFSFLWNGIREHVVARLSGYKGVKKSLWWIKLFSVSAMYSKYP